MRCSIVSNPSGEIVIFHDQDIRSDIQWIEFNPSEDQLYLIHEDGLSQNLGVELTAQMKKNLSHGIEVNLVRMVDDKPGSATKVTIVIQDY